VARPRPRRRTAPRPPRRRDVAGAEIGAGDGAGFERLRRLLPDAERAWATLVERRDWAILVGMLPRLFEVHDVGSMSLRYLPWVERALAAEPEDAAVRGRLLAHRSGCLQRIGRYPEMERDVAAALAALPAEPPLFEHWVALRARGNGAYLRGDLRAAAAAFEAALAVSERLDHRRYVAGCLNNLGLVFKSSGDLDRALGYLRRARSLTVRLDDAVHAQVLNNLATVQARRGAADDAERCFGRAPSSSAASATTVGLASVYTNLGNLRAQAGDHGAAERSTATGCGSPRGSATPLASRVPTRTSATWPCGAATYRRRSPPTAAASSSSATSTSAPAWWRRTGNWPSATVAWATTSGRRSAERRSRVRPGLVPASVGGTDGRGGGRARRHPPSAPRLRSSRRPDVAASARRRGAPARERQRVGTDDPGDVAPAGLRSTHGARASLGFEEA
jgi:tetratricopeptide (TPR) repeat protein